MSSKTKFLGIFELKSCKFLAQIKYNKRKELIIEWKMGEFKIFPVAISMEQTFNPPYTHLLPLNEE